MFAKYPTNYEEYYSSLLSVMFCFGEKLLVIAALGHLAAPPLCSLMPIVVFGFEASMVHLQLVHPKTKTPRKEVMGTVIVIALIAIVGFAIYSGMAQAKATEAAKQAYLEALSALKLDPHDADHKQKTLALGRTYSNLTRDKKGNTLFDEVALMNDINAACAAAGSSLKPQLPMSTPEKTIEERLSTLSQLKNRGLIEHSEYEKRRAEILESI